MLENGDPLTLENGNRLRNESSGALILENGFKIIKEDYGLSTTTTTATTAASAEPLARNADFGLNAEDIIDFSTTNPFGEGTKIMLGNNHFYHETIRRTVIAFGSVFNDIHIRRKNADGSVAQSLKVPLGYEPKQKFLARLYENPNLTNVQQLTLPRMGFEITGFNYDGQRKVNKLNVKKTLSTNASEIKRQYTSVPYNFQFSLFVMPKNQEDALQVVEQILPFFTPAFTLTINAVPEMGIKDDFPLILEVYLMKMTMKATLHQEEV